MTIDQFKKDLLLVAQNAHDLASSVGAVGNTATVLEVTDIQSVSDSDAESVIAIIKGIVPDIAKTSETAVQKKDAIAQLPSAFSIEGLFTVPAVVGGTIIWLIRTQIDGLRGRVLALANIMIQLSPPKYKEEGTSIRAQIDALFQQALDAYSS
ncbi:hypothetical protein F5887DRAFT_915090 [Amanita rubescens]|nr:hypothetical protein F5887DRAFT_915090 [Amanita rubescens]